MHLHSQLSTLLSVLRKFRRKCVMKETILLLSTSYYHPIGGSWHTPFYGLRLQLLKVRLRRNEEQPLGKEKRPIFDVPQNFRELQESLPKLFLLLLNLHLKVIQKTQPTLDYQKELKLQEAETPELEISKHKSSFPESEFVDVIYLKNRVFDLEQNSTEKDLIIGKQDIRISEIEKEKFDQDSKILELQLNLGGLITLFFYLKQHLFQKFDDEFQPLSAEG
ncbi:unnamed protein product [Lactuca saligna]|uniref:Uncharacterized protein n=1 Tax=Lactuca saligna TaxID=75948 RepID=A0AA35Y600_LACSI|nr:unnamed protein product [Lactuca saligna]